MGIKSLKKKISSFPDAPGVYLMKDKEGRVLYIGKATSLRKRLLSYLQKSFSSKIEALLESVSEISYIPSSSARESLLLEAELIKKEKPPYNVMMRDDKSFPLIKITDEAFPAIYVCRPKKKDKARYFGPYPQAHLLREALKAIRKIFGFRSCRKMPKKACLYFRLRLCPGPCVGGISQEEYKKIIQKIILLLEGKEEEVLDILQKKLEEKISCQDFESAAKIRDQIKALGLLYSKTRTPLKGCEELKELLKLKALQRIEAFDVSELSGQEAVGALISFWRGRPDKKNYRRFRIKEIKGINDYQMLAEIVFRRYRRLKEEKRPLPDLILIDGGKAHLRVAKKELKKLNLDIPVIALAKEKELLYIEGKSRPILLPRDSSGLKLLQQIRNEAHRFALKYHRLLRKKTVL